MLKIYDIQKLKSLGFLGSFLLVWIIAILVGTYQLLAYEYTSGKDENIQATWPSNIGLNIGEDGYTLLMLVHPKCSCSRASIGELSKLAARFPTLLHIKILYVTPRDSGRDWTESENWIAAQQIDGVEMIHDIDGKLAQQLNVQTSGYTLLYDDAGKLVFNGGITASRGHWGDNAGSQAISQIVNGSSSAINVTAAFGCHLFNRKK